MWPTPPCWPLPTSSSGGTQSGQVSLRGMGKGKSGEGVCVWKRRGIRGMFVTNIFCDPSYISRIQHFGSDFCLCDHCLIQP